jgi:peptidoglycan lytic transglycosylase
MFLDIVWLRPNHLRELRSKLFHLLVGSAFLAAILPVAPSGAFLFAAQISSRLELLAARAKAPGEWATLRRFAKSSANPEAAGLAWFTLGYREYAAGRFAPALQDLRSAAATNFALSDFAEYYAARAARAAERPEAGIEALRNFSSRHPQSLLRTNAVELLAEVMIEAKQPAQAATMLLADPELHSSPSLLLELGDAETQARNLDDAAHTDEEVFYHFPVSPQAGKADVALRELHRTLGSHFPEPNIALCSERAATLFRYGRFEDALREYTSLLNGQRSNPSAFEWKVSEARCLFHLRRYEQAAAITAAPMTGHPETDAHRLEVLVNIRAHQDNQSAMSAALNELGRLYPASPAYGRALSHAAFYYARRGNWKMAAPYYALAASGFPATPAGEEAAWKTAWFDYLSGDIPDSSKAIANFILRYPASVHVPAALYWLARISRNHSDSTEARSYLSGLTDRYPQRYYAFLARHFMPPLQPGALSAKYSPSGKIDADHTPLSAAVTRAIPSLQGTEVVPCVEMPASAILQPYRTFVALHLDDLAQGYLDIAAAVQPVNPWVFLALARADYAEGRTTAALFAARRAVPDYEDFEFDALPREVWDYLYPRSYWPLVRREALAHHLDPYLVMAVIRQESAFDPKAISDAGAVGLMQMRPQTVNSRLHGWRRRLIVRRLEEPDYNLRLSCHYLRRLIVAFGGDTGEALAAYNAGDVRVRQWLDGHTFRSPQEFVETTPFADTRAYVEYILRDREIYRQLLRGTAHFAPCDRSFPPRQKHPLRRVSRRRKRGRR